MGNSLNNIKRFTDHNVYYNISTKELLLYNGVKVRIISYKYVDQYQQAIIKSR